MKKLFSVCSLLLLSFVISCSTPNKNESIGEGRSLASEVPALLKVRLTERHKLLQNNVEELLSQMSDVGNQRAQLVRNYASALKNDSSRFEKEMHKALQRADAMWNVLYEVNHQSEVLFFNGKETDLVETQFDTISNINNENMEILVDAGLGNPANAETLQLARVSFMRFQSNALARAIFSIHQSVMDADLRKSYLELGLNFQKIPGKIAALSLDSRTVSQQSSKLLDSVEWKSFFAKLKKMPIYALDNGDIEGSSAGLDHATALVVGSRMLEQLLQSAATQRVPASQSDTQASIDFTSEFHESELFTFEKLDIENAYLSNKSVMQAIDRRPAQSQNGADELTLVGLIPGQYLGLDKTKFHLGMVEMKKRIITQVKVLKESEVKSLSGNVIVLKEKNANYQAVYPGLIDLHDHTKQNNLPVWTEARGQFENRFEWRDWNVYQKSVSQNMNPWIQYGKPIECAAFRWSEMQAMVAGTTYLQGPSNCVTNFGIQRVEDAGAFISKKAAVQAPTDIVIPADFTFVWQVLGPRIRKNQSYEEALAAVIGEHCPALKSKITAKTVNAKEGLAILGDQATLKKECTSGTLHPKFVRYIYFLHPGIAGRKTYLASANMSAVIGHLAEGRQQDAYNTKEYELLKLLGLNKPGMNYVHGVGIETKHFSELAKNKNGIIWSPFSNMILYGETLNVAAAMKAGVMLAIGSDWLPTGSKGPLEEVKVAAAYVDREKLKISDEELYKMMTENPAKMIGHWENIPDKEAGIGQIAKGSMGSLIVTSARVSDPYSNLVRDVREQDLSLIVIDGKVLYGNVEYLESQKVNFEVISTLDSNISAELNLFEKAPVMSDVKADATAHLVSLAEYVATKKLPPAKGCKFSSEMGFVHQESKEDAIGAFQEKTSLNLDRFEGIQRLLAVNVLTQGLNKVSKEGDPKFSTGYFAPLFSCNDEYHQSRIYGQVSADKKDNLNTDLTARQKRRLDQKLGKGPASLGEQYKD